MDISRPEQRILHLLAQGGALEPVKDRKGRIVSAACITRDGWRLPEVEMELFRKLKRKRAIISIEGNPYRITRRGLELVRSQPDNR